MEQVTPLTYICLYRCRCIVRIVPFHDADPTVVGT
jgi:hypothetical protein